MNRALRSRAGRSAATSKLSTAAPPISPRMAAPIVSPAANGHRMDAAVEQTIAAVSGNLNGHSALNGLALDPAQLFDLRRPPGYYNAAEKVALLRRDRKKPHDELLVDFRGRDVQLKLSAAGLPLIHGAWTWRATAAGQPLAAVGLWEESCWNRDADCDYLELSLKLNDGWRLDRQMLLARKDRFLYLADALVSPQREALRDETRYATSLPLADRTLFVPAAETREAWLVQGGKRRLTVVPPALAEWRTEFCHAELATEEGRVVLAQAALGRALYAPLFIDLDPLRARRGLTWRRLTVAENLEVVPRDVAAAYRVQVGREQWLVYRSLAPRGNRTFLGQNYSSEFVCTRFLPSGEAKDILAVE